MIKGSTQKQNVILVNIYAPDTGTPKYIKQILTNIKGDTDNNTIIAGDFNTPLNGEITQTKKINKAEVVISDTTDQLDLADIYSTQHPKKQNTHSFQVHVDFSPG